MNIEIQSIPHTDQRYETCGDWWFDDTGLHIRVSHTTDDNDFLIAMHELVEAYLCNKRGISEQAITDFDIEFEKNRQPGSIDEPGDSPFAPYRSEHRFATQVERIIAGEVLWTDYENTINSLSQDVGTRN
jgi:hypothetical protein